MSDTAQGSEGVYICWRCNGNGYRSLRETMGVADVPCPACATAESRANYERLISEARNEFSQAGK